MSQMLFKHPGPHMLHGIPCDYCIVDETEMDAKLESGEWHLSPAEALTAAKSKKKPEEQVHKKKVTKKKSEPNTGSKG